MNFWVGDATLSDNSKLGTQKPLDEHMHSKGLILKGKLRFGPSGCICQTSDCNPR